MTTSKWKMIDSISGYTYRMDVPEGYIIRYSDANHVGMVFVPQNVNQKLHNTLAP